ncbi:Zinc finger protein [Ceratobasidium theobromae]|uniref:Zinc finger protein n=1 Tax=Ceratobasidium theobromae TaxID=1582974 RepID=A0A5N5QJM4_9AGAM|nr:Zinc finger protein [Ceratobasidium theobromae]
MSPRTESDASVTADLPPGLERGGHASGDACPDVKVGRRGSEASIKSEFERALSRKNIKEEEEDADDPLTYLASLFSATTLDDSDDDSDTESDGSFPPSPCAKGFDPGTKKTYFYAMGRLYYYDEDRNIYLDNSPVNITLVHVGKPFDINSLTEMLEPDFYIQGIPYYFDHMSGALLYQDQTTFRTVHTWTPDPHNFEQAFSTTFVPRATGNVLQSNSEYTAAALGYQNAAYARVASDGYARDRQSTKHEVGTPDVVANGNSPGNSVMTGPWSPGSSAQSPIVSAGSRAPSEGLEPLIQSGYIEGIQLWQHQTKLAQGLIRPPDKMDRRRCPQCNKVFRRPSSLDVGPACAYTLILIDTHSCKQDHLNVHSGAKRKPILSLTGRLLTELTAHMCPFKNCRTGFATKSNMKRHFLTHRVGTLEEYSSGGVQAVRSQSRTTTYNSRAFHTQRFRLAN